MFIKMCLNAPSITRRLQFKWCDFFLLIFIVIVNEFIATNWMIFLFEFSLMLYNEIDEIFFVYLQTNCVEMYSSIERERLTPQKKSHTECLVCLPAAHFLVTDFVSNFDTSAIRIPSYRPPFYFYFLYLLRNSRTVE
jgi:hypothetical protein